MLHWYRPDVLDAKGLLFGDEAPVLRWLDHSTSARKLQNPGSRGGAPVLPLAHGKDVGWEGSRSMWLFGTGTDTPLKAVRTHGGSGSVGVPPKSAETPISAVSSQ